MSVLEQIYADLEREQAENKKLRDRLTYFDSLERELKRYWDENIGEET
jgi:cell division septum initiation protein DivIVA